jgi:hypothetical protein
MEIAMSRRRPSPQLELFPQKPPPPRGAPTWATLPTSTREALTGLVTRMLLSHVDGSDGQEGDDDAF